MLSRLAENLYWCGVYVERADATARLVDVTYHSLLESRPAEMTSAWRDVLRLLHADEGYKTWREDITGLGVMEYLVVDANNPSSIVQAVGQAREDTRSVRETVPTEFWEAVNDFHLDLGRRDLQAMLRTQPFEIFELVRWRSQAVVGIAAETMLRDDGWRFFTIGRLLERAKTVCRLLVTRYAELLRTAAPLAFHNWVSVLKSVSAFEAFRKSYRASMDPADVVEFLVLRADFPRSVLFCLEGTEHELAELTAPDEVTRPQRLIGRVRADLEYRSVGELLDEDLKIFLSGMQQRVQDVDDAIATSFFRNVGESDMQKLEVR